MNRAISIMLIVLAAMAIPVVGHAQDRSVFSNVEYTFGPEDIIQITVFGKPEFTGETTVDFRGMIQVPLVGEVRAVGRSPSALGEYLTERYSLLDPSISEVLVSIVEYMSRTIMVVGEVRSPGAYGFVEIPDLWQVILTAGGPTANADLGQVQILRAEPRAGEPGSVVVDLSAGIKASRDDSLPVLYPLDKVFVPSSEDVPTGDQDFQILGAVGEPGTYRISVATTVVEALSAAGGPLAVADLKSVYLTRATGTGTRSWRLNLENYLYAAQTPVNLDLLAGDTITVPEKNPFVTSLSAYTGVIVPIVSLAIFAAVYRR